MAEHNFRVDYLRHRLRPLIYGWWPDHPDFAMRAWREVKRAIDDAYDEVLRQDWLAVERARAKARAKVLMQIRKADTSLRKQRERMKPEGERHRLKQALKRQKAAARRKTAKKRKTLTIRRVKAQEAPKSTEV